MHYSLQRLASAGHDHTVRIWEMPSGRLLRTLLGHTDVVYALAHSPDGKRLATASWDHTVKVWATPAVVDEAKPLTTSERQSVSFSSTEASPE